MGSTIPAPRPPQKLTIGPYPALTLAEARKRAQKAKALIADGVSPQAEKQAARTAAKAKAAEAEKPVDLIADVAKLFIERHAKKQRPSTARELERLIEHDLLPAWGSRRLSTISKPDVHKLLDDLVDRAPIVANRALSMLKTLGRFSVERGIIDRNPFAELRKPAPEVARDRVLDAREIGALMSALDAEAYPIGPLVRLLLLLGQRRSEVAEARWPEFDLDAKLWRLPRERSKGGIERTLPLPDAVVDILRALPRFEGSDFVFTFDGVHPVSGFPPAKARIDAAMEKALGEPIKRWVLHDLRRSCASGMASLSVQPHVVERVLGHRSGVIKGVAAVYNRYSYQVEQLHALTAWAAKVRAIASGEAAAAANVVAFGPR